MSNKPLAEIEIPQFIKRVKTADSRRAKYYKNKKGGGMYPRSLPKTYKSKVDDGVYSFDSSGYLRDEKGEKVLANPRTAGKARYEKLSGNNLLSGYGSPHTRAKLARALKDFYRPFVQEHVLKHGPIQTFPLRVTWDMYTTVKKDNWDLFNLFFYYKYFEDSLHETTDRDSKNPILYKGKELKPLIPDDNIKFITWAPSPKLIPVDNWDDRKFIFRFYHDNRNELQQKPWV